MPKVSVSGILQARELPPANSCDKNTGAERGVHPSPAPPSGPHDQCDHEGTVALAFYPGGYTPGAIAAVDVGACLAI